MTLRLATTRPLARNLDQAVERAVAAYVDRLRLGVDLDEAYGAIATDALRSAAHLPVDRLWPTGALLDDETRVRFEPDMVRVPWSLQLRHMLGFTTRVALLPTPSTRGSEPALSTRRGTQLWTWPVASRGSVGAGLRGTNDGEPVLLARDGTRVWSPDDAARHAAGLLVSGPRWRVWLEPDGTPAVEAASREPVLARVA